MSNLHVVFGAGPLGRAVVKALAKRGQRVRVVSRSGQMQDAPAGVEVVSGDVYQSSTVRELTRGAVAAYQCAQPLYHEWLQKFPPLQAAVIEGLSGSGVKLILAENMYAYGDTNGQPLHEGLPYAAHTRKGRVRAQMTEAALAAHRAGKVRVAIGRGSDFFGPYVREALYGDRALLPVLQGKAAQMAGNVDLPHTATYIEDFGEALALLGERDEALGQAWHVPNDQPRLSQREWIALAFAEAGRAPKVTAMGRAMLSVAGLFIPGAREMVEMMYEFEKPFVVDSSKFEKAFGMKATLCARR
jgi:nucleoside-diphosphate-sugar epimerase